MIERRNYARRSILRAGVILPAAAGATMLIPEKLTKSESDFSNLTIDVIAHNAAADPESLEQALVSRAPFIEMDIMSIDGELVVAHSLEEYQRLTAEQRARQNPDAILERVVNSGHLPFYDFKDDIEEYGQVHDFMRRTGNIKGAMASSNRHRVLNDLGQAGFDGKILYSLGSFEAKDRFLRDSLSSFPKGRFGVSIRHSILRQSGVARELKVRNLSIAAWNPVSDGEIALACANGADFITSDSFYTLAKRVHREM